MISISAGIRRRPRALTALVAVGAVLLSLVVYNLTPGTCRPSVPAASRIRRTRR